MLTLRNLTRHRQSESELSIARTAGFELSPAPEGVDAVPGQDGLIQAAGDLASRLESCAERGEGVLAGGHTGMWVLAVASLLEQHRRVPQIYCFDVTDRRDEHGRAIFIPVGVLRVC